MENQAIAILTNEHRLILEGLDVALAMADRLEGTGEVPAADIGKIFDFITKYADEFHHKKEEDVLFKWMESRGFPADGGPIAVMLCEHDSGRAMIAFAKAAFERFKGGEAGAAAEIAAHLRGFAEHLRHHIFKEDNILYPMAQNLFKVGGEEDVVKAYREKVPEESARKMNDEYGRIVTELRGIYAG